jgi:hypothetical protein
MVVKSKIKPKAQNKVSTNRRIRRKKMKKLNSTKKMKNKDQKGRQFM